MELAQDFDARKNAMPILMCVKLVTELGDTFLRLL
jgi:hypothetical protein